MNYFLSFALLGVIYFLIFYKKWNKNSKEVLFINTVMYVYITMVLYVTLMPFTVPFINGRSNLFLSSVNLVPFRDLRLHHYGALREVLLNIIMMIPFGFLYPIITRKGILKTVFTTFFFSFAIEFFQLMSVWWCGPSPRAFDVTDLITNTTGGFIGYIVFYVLKPIIFKILNIVFNRKKV